MANLMASEMQSVLGSIPDGVDPFVYIANTTMSRLALTSSKYTIRFLVVLLFFHSVIVLFCLFLLIMSCISGVRHARWFVKSLYINDRRGHRVYSYPLYFVNAGVVMTVSQMLCSIAAAGYICIQIKSTHSIEYAVRPPVFQTLLIMAVFETLSHWSATHTFLVTIYVSRGFHQELRGGLWGWISPPIFINILFFGLPIISAAAAAGVMGLITFRRRQLASEVMVALDVLKQGSSAWKQLHSIPSPSGEESSRIVIQLVQVIPELKRIYNGIGAHTEIFIHSFYQSQVTLMVIACTSCTVFILVFCLLLRTYQPNASDCVLVLPRSGQSLSWLKRENISLSSCTDSEPTNCSRVHMLLANKQLFYLLIRAFGIFLSMITQMITSFVLVIKSRDVTLDNDWREIATRLVTVSGAWSAIPIAWQCWRLYVDQTRPATPPIVEDEASLPPKEPFNLRKFVELEMERERGLQVLTEPRSSSLNASSQDLQVLHTPISKVSHFGIGIHDSQELQKFSQLDL